MIKIIVIKSFFYLIISVVISNHALYELYCGLINSLNRFDSAKMNFYTRFAFGRFSLKRAPLKMAYRSMFAFCNVVVGGIRSGESISFSPNDVNISLRVINV